MEAYISKDGLALADMVRRGEATPKELVEAAIARIEEQNPQLNAVVYEDFERALKTAEEVDISHPFCGVPLLIKDLGTPMADAPMGGGSRLYNKYVPDHDAEIVKRLRAAGFLFVGKTSAPEFGLQPVTESEAYGITRNPWDLNRTPGGSSGGAGAAVAARMVPIAHGSDGGGSIRIPASCCGLFGLKPTRGRTPLGPDCSQIWQGLGCHHALTRSVRDSAAVLDAIQGTETGALNPIAPPARPYLECLDDSPGRLRIAYTAEPLLGRETHEDCVRGLEATVNLCKDLGHELMEAVPDFDREAFGKAFMTLVCAETRAEIEEATEVIGRSAKPEDVEASTWVLGLLGKSSSAADLILAQHKIHHAVRQIGAFFEDYDVLLTPTLAAPPLRIGALQLSSSEEIIVKTVSMINVSQVAKVVAGVERLAEKAFDFVSYTPLFNATGQPAMSVPLYWNERNVPIGMQFVGRFGREDQLFQLAAQLENAQPWDQRIPES